MVAVAMVAVSRHCSSRIDDDIDEVGLDDIGLRSQQKLKFLFLAVILLTNGISSCGILCNRKKLSTTNALETVALFLMGLE